MNEYRAVYAKGPQCDEPAVSGVGWASDSCVVSVPTPSNARYDDAGIHPSSFIKVSLLKPKVSQENDDSKERPWGFLVHDACWQLLTVACRPDQVKVPFLFRLMKSFPVSMLHIVYWGHDYGHVYDLAFPDRAATEENDFEDYKMLGFDSYEFPAALRLHAWDPTSPALVNEWIQRAQRNRADLSTARTFVSDQPDLVGDEFTRLPPELREHILCQLPSADVLSALIASRSLRCIGLSQTFWASRFQPGSEFGHFFEALEHPKCVDTFCDYRMLYDICCKRRVSRNHLCRKRVWTLLQPLAKIMALYDGCQLHGDSASSPDHQRCSLRKCTWQWASRSRSAEARTWSGSRTLQTRQIRFRGSIKRVDVSVVCLHALLFVTGIHFTYFDGSVDRLGYVLSTTKCIFEATDRTTHNLKGFAVGMGHMGVHGIGSLDETNLVMKWAGLSQAECTMQKLLVLDPEAVRGLFDVSFHRGPSEVYVC